MKTDELGAPEHPDVVKLRERARHGASRARRPEAVPPRRSRRGRPRQRARHLHEPARVPGVPPLAGGGDRAPRARPLRRGRVRARAAPDARDARARLRAGGRLRAQRATGPARVPDAPRRRDQLSGRDPELADRGPGRTGHRRPHAGSRHHGAQGAGDAARGDERARPAHRLLQPTLPRAPPRRPRAAGRALGLPALRPDRLQVDQRHLRPRRGRPRAAGVRALPHAPPPQRGHPGAARRRRVRALHPRRQRGRGPRHLAARRGGGDARQPGGLQPRNRATPSRRERLDAPVARRPRALRLEGPQPEAEARRGRRRGRPACAESGPERVRDAADRRRAQPLPGPRAGAEGAGRRASREGTLELRPELEPGSRTSRASRTSSCCGCSTAPKATTWRARAARRGGPHGVFARARRGAQPDRADGRRAARTRRPAAAREGVDMLDGTPILDVKPYLSGAARGAAARLGCGAKSAERGAG